MANSRNEEILESMINGTPYEEMPQSRIEALLLVLKDTIEHTGTSSIAGTAIPCNVGGAVGTEWLIGTIEEV